MTLLFSVFLFPATTPTDTHQIIASCEDSEKILLYDTFSHIVYLHLSSIPPPIYIKRVFLYDIYSNGRKNFICQELNEVKLNDKFPLTIRKYSESDPKI